MSTWNKHYHWKTKGCTPWAQAWLAAQLVGKSASADGRTVSIDKLSNFDGDVELGNRKGKLITIYDCAVTLSWMGEGTDGSSAGGTITFPELSHEVEDNGDEYQFETEMSTASTAETHALYQLVRAKLAPSLRGVLHSFRSELVDTHARDLGHDDTPAPESSGTDTPAVTPAPAPAVSQQKEKAPSNAKGSTSEVSATTQLAISAADLWDLLTNPARIPMWSRAAAQFSPNVDAAFSLFGGNIVGSVVSVEPPKKLVQTWRVPQWPSGHYGKLTTLLTQGDDSTKLELVLSGVPKGQEESAEAGLETYYIRGLKSIGLGTIL
ncbi:Co-chaperone [Malassezia sp. CBS 17886]|nr:Co-chaperone [Malassezia sp. CBS 17886]